MKLKRGVSKFMKRGALLAAIPLLAGGASVPFGAIPFSAESKSYEEPARKDETSRILPVLEERIGDPDILAKTKDKLFTLDDEEIRLISSLCDRISTGEGTARADVAFSLVTALIVLS
jgi:hypothetical protein